MGIELIEGDSAEIVRELADNSIDSCVTDPPYALVSIQKRFANSPRSERTENTENPYGRTGRGFMGQRWDTGDVAFDPDFWSEVWRVLKPGGHVLAFGGTRTYHRLACAVEDAGFEIRDQIGWCYGSGFPKSHNQHGDWEGWGTALKPAWEPIVVARKPLDGTVAENLLRWGVGALNIDGCRVNGVKDTPASPRRAAQNATFGDLSKDPGTGSGWDPNVGRWPANLMHDGSEEVLSAFPIAPGQIAKASSSDTRKTQNVYGVMNRGSDGSEPRDTGGSAARFFYCAKASAADRQEGVPRKPDGKPGNDHPTIKPTPLMQYLCRLVTPPGGTVLDPFMGSGSTGRGAVLEGFGFIGIEREAAYFDIADARIAAIEDQVQLRQAAE